MIFTEIKEDLKRYVKNRKDCHSYFSYLVQFLPIIFFHEGAIAVVGYRLSSWVAKRSRLLAFILSKIVLFFTGNYIHPDSQISPGCKINHSAVVIHSAKIGIGFECSANITIGQKVPYDSPFPTIGDYVMVGAGARVFSDVGDHVLIGANSVVINPVKKDCIVAGNPSKIVSKTNKYKMLYKTYITDLNEK